MVSAGDVTGSSRGGCVFSELTPPCLSSGAPRSGVPCGHSAVGLGTRHRQVNDKSHEMSYPLFGGGVAGGGAGAAGGRRASADAAPAHSRPRSSPSAALLSQCVFLTSRV